MAAARTRALAGARKKVVLLEGCDASVSEIAFYDEHGQPIDTPAALNAALELWCINRPPSEAGRPVGVIIGKVVEMHVWGRNMAPDKSPIVERRVAIFGKHGRHVIANRDSLVAAGDCLVWSRRMVAIVDLPSALSQ